LNNFYFLLIEFNFNFTILIQKKKKITTSLTLLYNSVAAQVSQVNTLLELTEEHGKFIGAWHEFLKKGAELSKLKQVEDEVSESNIDQ